MQCFTYTHNTSFRTTKYTNFRDPQKAHELENPPKNCSLYALLKLFPHSPSLEEFSAF